MAAFNLITPQMPTYCEIAKSLNGHTEGKGFSFHGINRSGKGSFLGF